MCFSSHFPPKNIPTRSFPISPFEKLQKREAPYRRPENAHQRKARLHICIIITPYFCICSIYEKDFENVHLDLSGQSILQRKDSRSPNQKKKSLAQFGKPTLSPDVLLISFSTKEKFQPALFRYRHLKTCKRERRPIDDLRMHIKEKNAERRPIDDLRMHIKEKHGRMFLCVRPGRGERRPIDDLRMHRKARLHICMCVRPGRVYSEYEKDFENMNLDSPGQSIL
ncbi:hypothetical protein CEXT_290191 [Caerostris extrusa]|uniref:Uncharacterized protein n=1 Tax=Caerostris extrusa TaxID=172846 RepID=A0AAV4QUH8_CAEEX|nr:hypothetical protein CEXT_290191 [Caerostris extrusa]